MKVQLMLDGKVVGESESVVIETTSHYIEDWYKQIDQAITLAAKKCGVIDDTMGNAEMQDRITESFVLLSKMPYEALQLNGKTVAEWNHETRTCVVY